MRKAFVVCLVLGALFTFSATSFAGVDLEVRRGEDFATFIAPPPNAFLDLGFMYAEFDTNDRLAQGFTLEAKAAAEAANNAVNGPTLVPLLTLGIPGSGTMALMLGALIALLIAPLTR